MLVVESLTAIARGRGQSVYRCPPVVPAGFEPVPLAFHGPDALPVVGIASRLWRTIFDPIGLVREAAAHSGDRPWTIRIPGQFDLTYLPGQDGYDTLMGLSASDAGMGSVFSRVPVIGMWYPRHGRIDDHDSLQELVLMGRRIMAQMLSPDRVAGLPALIETVMRDRMRQWGTSVDLAEVLYQAVYEISIRFFAGEKFWSRFGEELIPVLRAIADGIDIPRAALAVTPARFAMREYRASRRLVGILRRAHREIGDADSPLFAAIHAAGVHRDNCSWMTMYVLWNATAYPGSYSLWTLVDAVTDARTSEALAATDQRTTLLSWCMWETIRLNPISSLVRSLSEPLEYSHDGHRYYLPAGTLAGVAPWLLNRDSETWDRPNDYLPERFSGVARPRLFGAGPFSCVAAEYSRVLITGVCDAILTAREISFPGPIPARRCRVHLTYPSGPVVAELPVRAQKPQAVLTNA
ncbi:cytochrome P450 [Nocardia sp. NPDC004860]|uniref:cytochrome P450 n=1 Tax=Nocardia sp. NPDC004860 TaxID=3154557 RepID=UPI0033A45C85